jgi:hypothetical protein
MLKDLASELEPMAVLQEILADRSNFASFTTLA